MSQFYQGITVGSLPPSVPLQFTGNGATIGIPSGNNFNIIGAGSVTVTMSGSTATITDSGGGLVWEDKAISFLAESNKGYFCTAALTATMPVAPAQGDEVEFCATTAGVITVLANAGQSIRVGNDLGTQCASSAIGDSISFTYRLADLTWYAVTSPQGNWTTT